MTLLRKTFTLEGNAGLLVDQARDALDAATASQAADGGLGDALDVVAEHLAVAPGAALAQSLAARYRHRWRRRIAQRTQQVIQLRDQRALRLDAEGLLRRLYSSPNREVWIEAELCLDALDLLRERHVRRRSCTS